MAGGIDQRPLAVVTGASAGLGAAFARELAARGHDLVIVARRQDRLIALAVELTRFGAAVEVAAHDLAVPAQVDALVRELRTAGRPVSLLVNNAGFGRYAEVMKVEPDMIRSMIEVNCAAPLQLARAVAADMRAGAGGSIINVASTAAFQPVPHFSVYAATKAFVLSFSESMHVELKPKVRVLAVCPGFTKTEFHDAAGGLANHLMRFPAMDPVKVVRAALRAVERGRAVVIPGAMNKGQVLLSKFFPRAFVRWTASKLFEPRD
jgi:short-subunit dehydrogenase